MWLTFAKLSWLSESALILTRPIYKPMAAVKRKTTIPLHQLELEHTLGFKLKYIDEDDLAQLNETLQEAHRDDHYIFFLQERGRINIMVDFRLMNVQGSTLGFILPGQVHHYQGGMKKCIGWFLAIDAAHIDGALRAVFENKLLNHQMVKVKNPTLAARSLSLIQDLLQEKVPLDTSVIHHLLNAFIGMVAGYFRDGMHPPDKPASRVVAIVSSFRQLVTAHYRVHKSPSAYAALLNISVTYLNEAVKKQTGFPATYWIQQELLLEAKRLLYHTDLTVKEIAHRIGFEDHAYFSRLFRKAGGITPLAFRSKYRELSNHHR